MLETHNKIIEEYKQDIERNEKIDDYDFIQILLSKKGKLEIENFKKNSLTFQFEPNKNIKVYDKMTEHEKRVFVVWIMIKNRLESYFPSYVLLLFFLYFLFFYIFIFFLFL